VAVRNALRSMVFNPLLAALFDRRTRVELGERDCDEQLAAKLCRLVDAKIGTAFTVLLGLNQLLSMQMQEITESNNPILVPSGSTNISSGLALPD
jgi:hypothetical protein